jgi:SulP family sulfate permease
MRFIETPPRALIVIMKHVPVIDATGVRALEEVYKQSKQGGTVLILTEMQPFVHEKTEVMGFLEKIGKENVCETYADAVKRATVISESKKVIRMRR